MAENERFSVSFIPVSMKALGRIMKVTGLGRVDAINRAVQVYAFVAETIAAGNDVLVQVPSGELHKIHIV